MVYLISKANRKQDEDELRRKETVGVWCVFFFLERKILSRIRSQLKPKRDPEKCIRRNILFVFQSPRLRLTEIASYIYIKIPLHCEKHQLFARTSILYQTNFSTLICARFMRLKPARTNLRVFRCCFSCRCRYSTRNLSLYHDGRNQVSLSSGKRLSRTKCNQRPKNSCREYQNVHLVSVKKPPQPQIRSQETKHKRGKWKNNDTEL